MYQPPLPQSYRDLTRDQALDLIAQRKKQLSDQLVILGHHYQNDDIIQFADFTGDSLKLSQLAAQQKTARFIIFCGVHFMAESADILTAPDQIVLLPDLTAGCPMADMADIDQVEAAWHTLTQHLPNPQNLVPICYVNSSAAIKAFCGRHNGASCTSSNCRAIFQATWNSQPDALIFFMPDEHLSRNTAYAMGIPLHAMPVWDPYLPDGGLSPQQIRSARLILWKGFCSVHQEFTPRQITLARRENPDIKIIVHPECSFDVVQQADLSGSTAQIINTIRAAQPGSVWAVGTEINLVNRLARELAPKNITVRSLSPTVCLCETMYRINLPHLAWIIDTLAHHLANPQATPLPNRVTVDDQTKHFARLALQKMLDLTAAQNP